MATLSSSTPGVRRILLGVADWNPFPSLLRRFLLFSPGLFFVVSYLIAISIGTWLLKRPWATKSGSIDWIDALFTSTSAFCVTGLSVVDTGSYFTFAGQFLIMIMVQVGGLGIMTFAALLFLSIGWTVSMRQRSFIQGTYASDFTHDIKQLIVFIFAFTFIAEFLGAVLLMPCWGMGPSFRENVFYSVFHSVCSFCNAGFSLFPDSFVRYRGNVLFIFTVTSLTILGGIGFPVMRDVIHYLGRTRPRRLTLNTRISLVVTVVLIILGTALFWALESRYSMAGMPWQDQFLVSYFQSVSARTAGFYSMDFRVVDNATLLLFMVLMFIGTSPGSTGGGIKTTSIGVLAVVAGNRIRGSEANNVFRATLSDEAVTRTITVFIAAVIFILLMIFLHMVGQQGDAPLNQSRGMFIEYLFEVVSAFGTVGLSTGITPRMDVQGKLLIIVTMFVGRVGILTLVYLVAARKHAPSYRYAEENILIG
ncbi:MAG: Potassium/sodium uptake protein NtpJ [Deltaproteobacteria bacterium ADurb.BinA179]|jgi:trk system potassium uptake protein TrkH|nr:hypothetical protein [Deltaproteobacteria bacterium]MDI9542433.1 TrkH family potassium uptake protein [Pseudomonadota bacterium]OPZ26090.1 MAG: Potassium/sodium uptake protein NtpJ [Deltaproteobacteria bacterium ADurb.BinA179]HNU74536.1 TrkH family potassium uptake protein [Deltaproteobacteria bacterium]HOD69499.1 TrkH family potassium uptake protein [Deltaproteobacteria bacterium]